MKTPKVLVATPCAGDIPIETMNSFMTFEHMGAVRMLQGSLVDDARESIALDSINEGYDYVLWIDSDMVFEPDYLKKLLAHKKEVISGIYFKRVAPFTPIVYKKNDKGTYEVIMDYPKNQLFEIDGCGCGFLLTKVSVLKDIYCQYGTIFKRAYPFGEDLSFCARYKELNDNNKIWCDSSIKCGHVAKTIINESTYDVVRKKYEQTGKG